MPIQILFDSPAPRPLAFAAQELRRYLARMLSPAPPSLSIRLEVRPDGEDGLAERYDVDMGPCGGTITGSCPRAVLLGVYDLLRRLGCRFLGPGEAHEIVPSIPPAALACRYHHRASFRHRGVCIEGADSMENILDFIDWLPKAGYNSFFLQFKAPYIFLARWYRHDLNPLARPRPYSPGDARRDLEELEAAVKQRGLLLHKVGHGWTGEVLGYESLSWTPDERPLAEEKRPLAAEIGGVRALWKGVSANTNLCLSNPQAADAFAGLVAGYAKEHRDVDYLHVWLADEYNNVCQCPDCCQTTLSDQYVELLNEIDRRLTAEGLPTRIVFLLYQELLWPPIRARLLRPERFILMFAPISRTFETSCQVEDSLPPIPPYLRNRVVLPTGLGENLAFLRGWQEQFQGDGFVYDYPLGRAHYGDFGYMKISRVIAGDVKQLNGLGLNGYISCQELRAGLPSFLPNYMLGRVLMDREADPEEVIAEYCSAAYGPDWREAADYLDRLSLLSSTDYVNGKGPRKDPDMARRMGQVLDLCRDFAPTLKRCRDSGPLWPLLAYHREYVLRFARALQRLASGDRDTGRAEWLDLRDFICENEPDFQPYLDVYRVLEVTAKYTGFPAEEA